MPETATFSALVDEVQTRSQRKDRTNDIVAYARSTIRECQVLAFFEQDMLEDQLTVTALPFLWTVPLNLRTLLAASPNAVLDRRGKKKWFKNIPPGQKIVDVEFYLYRSGDSYVFTGTDLENASKIDIAYFTYTRKFVYYAVADRPATYDPETELWTYHATYDVSDAKRTEARNLVTNWLVFRWYDLILEGTLAKLFKVINDERSKSTFALYKQMQKDLQSGERIVLLNDTHDLNG